MSIDENLIPAKRMFVTTTLAVIMFTTIVQVVEDYIRAA